METDWSPQEWVIEAWLKFTPMYLRDCLDAGEKPDPDCHATKWSGSRIIDRDHQPLTIAG